MQPVVASVRVVDARTSRPVAGKVWFVDTSGVQVSAAVRLSRYGWATLSRDLPNGTNPGAYTYRIRYGGNARLRPMTSTTGVWFRVAMPPKDPTVDSTWADAPDVTNEDFGDLSGFPGFDPNYGNSWNQTMEDTVDWIYQVIASYNPGVFMIPGDLVEGRWGNPANTSGMFGTPDDLVSMLKNQAAFFHGENVRRLEQAGLFDKTYAALGDHDIGDNPWLNYTFYGQWKRQHLSLWRQAFHDAYFHKRDGASKCFSHTVGTEWDNTTCASMINPDTLLVTLDEFNRLPNTVNVEVVGAQIRWLDAILSQARRAGIRWIIVQGHTPILPAITFHSSALHIAGGTSSPLWKTLVKYHVNLYLAGEVHATSRVSRNGVTQLDTGAPVGTGQTTFAYTKEYHDRMVIVVRGWDVPRNTDDGPLWQGGCSTPVVMSGTNTPECAWSRVDPGNLAFKGIYPTVKGSLTLYLNGNTSPGTGDLTPYTGSGFG